MTTVAVPPTDLDPRSGAGSEAGSPGPGKGPGPTTGRRVLAVLPRLVTPLVLAAVLLVFSRLSSEFLTGGNLLSVADQCAILALVAVGLTVVVRAGGIDLSVGVALDLAALTAAQLLGAGYVTWIVVVGALLTAAIVGLLNALLVVGLGITPFMATLSVWFVGTSVQQIRTEGGTPVYLSSGTLPVDFVALGEGTFLGLGLTAWTVLLVAVVAAVVLGVTRWGRSLVLVGAQPEAGRLVGLRTARIRASTYVLTALACGLAGALLVARTSAFLPNSGQAYLLDAIGAVFVGATLSRRGVATVGGTLVGVALFALLVNGMSLAGIAYFWQGLARGGVLLLVLVVVAGLRRRGA